MLAGLGRLIHLGTESQGATRSWGMAWAMKPSVTPPTGPADLGAEAYLEKAELAECIAEDPEMAETRLDTGLAVAAVQVARVRTARAAMVLLAL